MQPIRVILYARVSTEDQLDGNSIETQLYACRQYALQNKYVVVGEESEDVSGVKLDRPKLNLILEQAAQRRFERLVVYDLDRFARDPGVQFILERDFAQRGVTIEYVTHNFDDTPIGDFEKLMTIGVAQLERRKIRERTMRGKIGAARAGKLPSSIPKYGYRLVDGMFEIHEEAAEVIRRIFDWYLQLKLSTNEIARRLTEQHVPARADISPRRNYRKKTGPGYWVQTAIVRILHDETYIGNYWFNKTKHPDGGAVIQRPREDWVLIKVPAILDEATFYAVQAEIDRRRHVSKRNTKHFALLQNRMRCAECGGVMGLTSAVSRGKDHRRYHYYKCSQARRFDENGVDCGCKSGALRIDIVDPAAWDAIKEFLQDTDRIQEVLLSLKNNQDTETEQRIRNLEAEIVVLEGRQGKLLDLFLTSEKIPRELLETRSAELEKQIGDYKDTLALLQKQRKRIFVDSDIEQIFAAIQQIQEVLDCATDEQKKFIFDVLEIRGIVNRAENIVTLEGLLPTQQITIHLPTQTHHNTLRFTVQVTIPG